MAVKLAYQGDKYSAILAMPEGNLSSAAGGRGGWGGVLGCVAVKLSYKGDKYSATLAMLDG